ncbi:MAG TPA: hypothetical protein VGL51_10250 [Solirubrobacteraceae bacterium]
MRERGRCDPEIVCTDHIAALSEFSPDAGMDAGDCACDRDRCDTSQQMLNECTSPRSPDAIGSMDAVEQLADRDYADCSRLLPDNPIPFRRADASFEVDEQVCVDQDGHEACGASTVSRSARTSSANSSSGVGALAMSSRNRSAEIRRCAGAEITATAAPLRVTSISSPAATRLSTSENERAASVAVMRGTTATLSDKSDCPTGIPNWYHYGMSKQIAVRLADDLVEFVDGVVGSGKQRSRAAVVSRALERERRRMAAARDAEILAATGPDPELAGLAEHAVKTAVDS